jgi:RNA polymerase sigma-70 factor (ECF subfamily)
VGGDNVNGVLDLPVDTTDPLVAFYRSTVGEVFAYLSRLCGDADRAADLTQEVYASVLREMRAGRLVDPTVGWAIVVGRNKFLDGIRRSRREERRLAMVEVEHYAEPDWDAVGGGDALRLLGRLSDEHRAALVLRYLDDLPVADVAMQLHRSVAATDSRLARARRQLAHLVEEDRHE